MYFWHFTTTLHFFDLTRMQRLRLTKPFTVIFSFILHKPCLLREGTSAESRKGLSQLTHVTSVRQALTTTPCEVHPDSLGTLKTCMTLSTLRVCGFGEAICPPLDSVSFNKFIYVWLLLRCCVGFSLVATSGSCSLVGVHGLLIAGASGCCGTRAPECMRQHLRLPGSRAQAQKLRHTGLVALQHVRSSWAKDRTPVSCFGRQTLHH